MKSKSPAKASALPAETLQKTVATYRKTILDNGVRVVTEEIPHVRSVSVGAWIENGSRDENSQNNGISHFIEHMVFKGTTKRALTEISRSVESVGGYLNAFTSKEHTCYYARVLDEYTELALDVVSDIAYHPTFPEKELEKERGVVIEELKNAEDDPDEIIHDYLEKSLFDGHPLGFPIIGTEENLRSFTRPQLVEFHQSRYLPQNTVLAASGRLKHDTIVRMAAKYLGTISVQNGQQHKREKPKTSSPGRKDYEKPIQQSHVCMGTVGYSVKSKYRYPLLVLNTLLGDGMSSRLFQTLREKHGLAYSVYSFANMLSDTGSFGIYAGTDGENVEASIELIWKELEKLKAREVPAAELKRTKAQLKGSMMLSLESIPNRMMRLGTSELYFQELKSLDWILQQIDDVDQEAIQAVAHQLFVPERFVTVVFRAARRKSGDYLGFNHHLDRNGR